MFGYAVGIDMTRRDLQDDAKKLPRPWEVAKAFERSAPCTALVPAEHVENPSRGAIWLEVNGQRKQTGDLSQMIWDIPNQIAFLSNLFELKAGDLIFTGTPAGVGAIKKGDKMKGSRRRHRRSRGGRRLTAFAPAVQRVLPRSRFAGDVAPVRQRLRPARSDSLMISITVGARRADNGAWSRSRAGRRRKQEDRHSHFRAGAVSRHRRDDRQERADDALKYNVEASNFWAFFQAKTIRKTTLETAAEQMEVDLQLAKDPAVKELLDKRANAWKARAARYESEPDTQEGRKELMARALDSEAKSERRPGASTIISSSARPPSRSPSCSRPPISSPASFICFGAPAASESSASCLAWWAWWRRARYIFSRAQPTLVELPAQFVRSTSHPPRSPCGRGSAIANVII